MSTEKFARDRFDADLIARALEDAEFRSKLVANPTEVYAEELEKLRPGQTIPDGVEIRVAEETGDVFYLVLPFIPPEMHLSGPSLEKVAKHEFTHRDPCWGLGDAPE